VRGWGDGGRKEKKSEGWRKEWRVGRNGGGVRGRWEQVEERTVEEIQGGGSGGRRGENRR